MKAKNLARDGSALLTVLGIVSVVSVICGMLTVTASQQTRASQITRESLKARMIAESGLNKAYHAVKGNFELAGNYQLSEDFGDGHFTVTSGAISGGDANRAQLFSEGVCGLGKATVAADLENRPLSETDDGDDNFFALDYDLLVGGTLQLCGNFFSDVLAVHANGDADLGGSANLAGDPVIVSSVGTASWKKAPASVTLLSGQPAQAICSGDLSAAIDALKDYAAKKGAVYASGSQIPFSPPGGIAYCTGSSDGWSGDGAGCFIFEGNYSQKHLNVATVNNYPALVVLSPSSVHFNAGTVIRGALILPSSSLKFNGYAAIYGPILVGQGMSGLGTADLYAGGGQGFALPPAESSTDNVVITAWH